MTKNLKRLVMSNKDQLNLFDLLLQEQAERQQARPGRLNVRAQLDAAVKSAAKLAPKSRETIADEMTALTGEKITVCMLNNWLSDSHPHRMPAEYYPVFCVSAGSVEPMRILAEAAGVFTVKGPDALRAEIQKLDEDSRKLQAEKRKRQLFLQELEGKR